VSKRPFANVLVLSAALVIAAGPYVVRAAGIGADPGTTANVDIQRIYSESDARRAADDKIRAFGQKLGQNFDEIARLEFLTAAEISDYSAALNAETVTPMETKRIADLKKANADRADEFQTLTVKKDADLTAKDRERMRAIGASRQQRPQVLGNLQKLYQDAVEDEQLKQTRIGVMEIRAIVAKLAKEQAITQVFDTSAMVVAPVDLTDMAIKKAKKK
jgi:Skp family chaperone for outer membrane proteins